MKKIIITVVLMLFSLTYAVSLDDKISQMIMVGFDGNNSQSKDFKYILKNINSITALH